MSWRTLWDGRMPKWSGELILGLDGGPGSAMPEVPPSILRSDRIEGLSVYPLRRLAGAQIRAVTVP